MKKMTLVDLEKMNACTQGLRFAAAAGSVEKAWETCQEPSWLFWFLRVTKSMTKVQTVKIAVDFADRALARGTLSCCCDPGYKKAQEMIQAARAWLNKPDEKNGLVALSCFNRSPFAGCREAAVAAYCAGVASKNAEFSIMVLETMTLSDILAQGDNILTQERIDAAIAAGAAAAEFELEKIWQSNKIREIFGNPFLPSDDV